MTGHIAGSLQQMVGDVFIGLAAVSMELLNLSDGTLFLKMQGRETKHSLTRLEYLGRASLALKRLIA